MKLCGGFFAEVVNILLIVESESIVNVVKDFIALGIIAEIDDIMILSVSTKVTREVEEMKIFYQKNQVLVDDLDRIKKIYEKDPKECSKIEKVLLILAIIFFKFWDSFYTTTYFYFFPIFCNISIFVWGPPKTID